MAAKKIGLALSGGGARGFAHLGALKVLIENGITFNMIAGTSAGSIVGGCLAAGMTIGDIVSMAERVSYASVLRPYAGLGGMFSNAPLGTLLTRHLPVKTFEELKVPFAVTAFDLRTNDLVVKKRGDLVTAIRASCAVPGVFAPVVDADGRRLLDGGVVCPLPVTIVREMGADVVIAIDLLACGTTFRRNARTAASIMIRSVMNLLQVAADAEHAAADIVISPAIAHLRPDQIGKRDEFIALGEHAANEALDEIKQLAG